MDNILKKLFDYQKFEQNTELQDIIDETMQSESAPILSDELLGAITGGKTQVSNKKEDDPLLSHQNELPK